MSFKRLEADDFVISSDSITAAAWVGNVPTLTYFFTSSTQAAGSSGNYYLNVYSSSAAQDIQFAIAYGNEYGSGSVLYNSKKPLSILFLTAFINSTCESNGFNFISGIVISYFVSNINFGLLFAMS